MIWTLYVLINSKFKHRINTVWPLLCCWSVPGVPGVKVVLDNSVYKNWLFVTGVTGFCSTSLDKSPGPQNIESLRSTMSGNRNGEGSFEDVGLKIFDEAIEIDAGDFIFESKFNWRLTILEGWGRVKNGTRSSLTGVTKGVVSGVASMAASGGDSRVFMTLGMVPVSVVKKWISNICTYM